MSNAGLDPALLKDVPEAAAPATPVGRLVVALLVSQSGYFLALGTPFALLLSFKMIDLVGQKDAPTALGLVVGLSSLIGLLAVPVGGRLTDATTSRFGRRRPWVLGGAAGGALMLTAIGFATAVWQVLILWTLAFVLLGFQASANTALIADQVPRERRGSVSGILALPIVIGPVSGIALVNAFRPGTAAQWLVLAPIALVAGVVAVLLVREVRHVRPAPTGQRRRLGDLARTYWVSPRRFPGFGWAWIVRFLLSAGFAVSSYNLLFLLDRFALSKVEASSVTLLTSGLVSLATIIVSVGGGIVSDRLQRQKPFVFVAGLLCSAAFVVVAFSASVPVFVIGSVAVAAATGIYYSVDLALCVRMLPNQDDAGKDMGLFGLANTIPTAILPLFAPLLLGAGGFTLLYLVVALLLLLGALAVLRLPEIGQEAGTRFVVPVRREP